MNACAPNTEWQVLKAAAGFVPGLEETQLNTLLNTLEEFVRKLHQSTGGKASSKEKQRNAALTMATVLVRAFGPRIAPLCDRFLDSLLVPLRDPLLCAELIEALATDEGTVLTAFLPRLLRPLLAYAKANTTSWELLKEVYETLGLIVEHGRRPAAAFASEVLASVLSTLPRALLHAGAEGITCIRRVLLTEGVTERVLRDHNARVCQVLRNVLSEHFDDAAPLESDEQEDEVDLDSNLMLEALDCATRLTVHPHVGPHFGAFAEWLVEFLVNAVVKPLLLGDDAAVRVAQVESLVQLLVQRPALRSAARLRSAQQAVASAAALLREDEEDDAAAEVEKQLEKLKNLSV